MQLVSVRPSHLEFPARNDKDRVHVTMVDTMPREKTDTQRRQTRR